MPRSFRRVRDDIAALWSDPALTALGDACERTGIAIEDIFGLAR